MRMFTFLKGSVAATAAHFAGALGIGKPALLRMSQVTLSLSLALVTPCEGWAAEPTKLTIVGGLSGISQFTRLEKPFWSSEITDRSGGRVQASVHAYDESGFRGQEMLQLMRLGVVPFGTALLAVAAGEEPELNAVDLAALNPDMPTLRDTVDRYRDRIRSTLRDRYGVELLGIYSYPAQVLFCTKPFSGLSDIAGRRVRTSSVGQSELVTALGAVPAIIPFAEMVGAVRAGTIDCAITGTLSGNEIGLADVTTHVHAMAVNWGLSIFGANTAAWQALPLDMRETIRSGVAELEERIWKSAAQDTALGLACNTGAPSCDKSRRRAMTLVPETDADEAVRRRLLVDVVLPRWVERCGAGCAAAWNALLAPSRGIAARDE